MVPMDILAGLAAAKTSSDLVRTVREILSKPSVDTGAIEAKLLELSTLLLDGRQALLDAQEEMGKLKKERDEALKKLEVADDMEFCLDGQFYVRKSESANGLIPYCPTCWKAEGKTVHLKLGSSGEYYTCTIHPTWKYQTQAQKAMAEGRIAQARSGPSVVRSSW